jgi:hypothetical protein
MQEAYAPPSPPSGPVEVPRNVLEAFDAKIREFNRDLLTGDVAGVDAEEIWQWGFIERVSTGLHTLQLGHPGARDLLAAGGPADA